MSNLLYSGIGEIQKQQFNPTDRQKELNIPANTVLVGYVLDVVLSEQDINYKPDLGQYVGCVRVKLLPGDYNQKEDDITTWAQPLDRSDYRLPLPGEQILCIQSYGSRSIGFQPILNYFKVVTTYNTIVNNIEPFLGGTDGKTRSVIQNLFNNLTLSVFANRFNSVIQHNLEVVNDKAAVERLSEGDKILEGRFGGIIKFTSTNEKDDLQRDFFPKNGTVDGDPLLIIKNTRKEKLNTYTTTVDKPDTDDAIIYLTTTQNIPKKLGCSAKLFSWDYGYVANKQTQAIDTTSTYSKVVDLTVPISQSYQLSTTTSENATTQ